MKATIKKIIRLFRKDTRRILVCLDGVLQWQDAKDNLCPATEEWVVRYVKERPGLF